MGWAMRNDARAELVTDALEMAVWRRKPAPGLVHHSDRGCSTHPWGPTKSQDFVGYAHYAGTCSGERCSEGLRRWPVLGGVFVATVLESKPAFAFETQVETGLLWPKCSN